MKKLNFISLIICVAIVSYCQPDQQEDKLKKILLKGQVLNPRPGENIVLFKYNGQQREAFDTIVANTDGSFEQEFSIDEIGIYVINFYQRQERPIILHNQHITIKADGSKNDGIFEVSGSIENDHLKYLEELEKEIAMASSEVRVKLAQAATQEEFENIYNDFNKNIDKKRILLLKKIKGSYASMMLAGQINPDNYLSEITEVANTLFKKHPTSKTIAAFREQILTLKKVNIGEQAPEISMHNPEGKIVSLSSLKGKVVLVDFWASWCKPCRIENPNVVKIYKRFKAKGFEIFSVSLDRSKKKWLEAIEQDSLKWLHVSDLKFWSSAAVEAYQVRGIPMTVLIDKQGKIIAKNLRGRQLETKLEEIFL